VEPRPVLVVGLLRYRHLPAARRAAVQLGDRILNRLALLALVLLVPTWAHAGGSGGRVVGKVTITDADGKPANTDAIIYVVGFTEPPGTTATSVAQKDRKFVPDLVAITVGEHVTFPNGDAYLHNVFSQSNARKFDLGSFKRGDAKDKDFPDPGVVDVYCNIHPEMAATILVLPNRRHTTRNADGSYAIEGVPPGTWTVFAYTRRAAKPASAPVTVVAGQDVVVNLALQRGAEPEHRNKYGEKYHDYATTTYR
jgi:plastocyanin